MKITGFVQNYMWRIVTGLFVVLMLSGFAVCAEETSLSLRAKVEDTSGAHLTRAEEFEIMTYSAQSSGWAYGNQLDGNAAQIYHTLAQLSNMRAYTIEDTIYVKLQNPYKFKGTAGRIQAEDELSKAIHAFIKDYGEYYWLDSYYGWLLSGRDESSDSYSEVQLVPRDYYSGIRNELTETDVELQKAIRAVAAQSGRYQKVKTAHDYVISLITYNTSQPYAEYGHTITGGLLSKYGHKAVCECYAKLFKLICNANGIPCILVTGGSSTDAMGNVVADHMWNYVQMEDGLWYLVDTTWDDRDNGIPDYTYFLAGAQTMGNLGETVDQDHIPVGRFNDVVEYEPFVVPVLAENSYASVYDVKIPVQKMILEDTTLVMDVGQGKYVSVKSVFPIQANDGMNYRYSSSDISVAEISETGYVTAKKAGTVTVTVSSSVDPAVKAVCKVTVQEHQYDKGMVIKDATFTNTGEILYTCVHGCGESRTEIISERRAYVTLNASSIPLQKGKSTTALKITGYDPKDSVLAWTSSKKSIATVDKYSGKIKAKRTGKTTITVTMKSGAKAKCVVKVQKGKVRTKKLSVSKKEVSLKKGEAYQIRVIRTPITAKEALRYTSSKKSVATVDKKSGKVKAKKKGTAIITVRSSNGKKVKVKVKVS